MTALIEAPGVIYDATLTALAAATATEYVPRKGASSIVLFVKAAGACTVDVYDIDADGVAFHCTDGVPEPVAGGTAHRRMVIDGPMRLVRVVVTDTSNASNAVKMTINDGGF